MYNYERRRPVKKVFKYMKGYGKEVVLAPLMKMLEAIFELLVPLAVASMIDKGIGGGDGGHIVKMCLVMVLLCAVGLCVSGDGVDRASLDGDVFDSGGMNLSASTGLCGIKIE